MAWHIPGALDVPEREQVVWYDERRDPRSDYRNAGRRPAVPSRRDRLTRWAREHRLAVAFAIVLAWALTVVLAFEAGHAYAEGVRTLDGFVEHLGGMVEHYLAGWLWRPAWRP